MCVKTWQNYKETLTSGLNEGELHQPFYSELKLQLCAKRKNDSSILSPDHHGHFNHFQLGTMASDGADPYLFHYKEKVTAGGHCSVKY